MRMIPSKNMGSVSELTLLADVRPELVEIRPTMTHGTRLRALLRTLYGIRRAAVEETVGRRLPGPLESLEFLHFVRFALLDNDTKFLLGVTFDGAWEPYIRAIAERAGPLLDVIFCHCEGYNAHSSDRGYPIFAKWVRAHQIEADFFFADAPSTTAKDVKLLKAFHRRICDAPEMPEGPPTPDDVRRGIKALHQLHGLDAYFPAEHEKTFLRQTAQMILRPIHDAIAFRMDQYRRLGTGQELVHQRALDWVKRAPADGGQDAAAVPWPVRPARPSSPQRPDPESEVQGNILEPYADQTHGATLLFRISHLERAQTFLRELPITRQGEPTPVVTCNLGLTHHGLETLGVPPDQLEKLPFEFRQGMQARAGWLGDLGVNHPARWQLPRLNWPPERGEQELRVRLSSVDFVLQLQTKSETAVEGDHVFGPAHPLYDWIVQRFSRCDRQGVQLLVVEAQRAVRPAESAGRPWGMEHFGHLDGVSQPTAEAYASGEVAARDRVALGELVLGYADDKDGVAAPCELDFLRNGSFQAVRKLSQDVARFRAILAAHPEIPELGTRMMGKPAAETDPLYGASREEIPGLLDFDYDDPDWDTQAPRDSHTRRSNPRNGPAPDDRIRNRFEKPLPRIARRGMPYGSAYSEDRADEARGILFTCFNASLADQFEVVQRWLAGANSTDAVGLRNDAFLAVPEPGAHKTFTLFDEDGKPERTIDLGTEPLVRLEWGLYLFMPSRTAIDALTRADAEALACADRASDADVEAGEGVIGRMETLLAVERARDPERAWFLMALRWKALIEDPSARETMRQVWAAIRARGGMLETPYGVLVGGREQIGEIFAHRDDFSVSGYWDRMRDSLGEHYLGMDPDPAPMARHANAPARVQQDRYLAAVDGDRYAREATFANAWIAKIDEGAAFRHAYATARAVLRKMIWAGAPTSEDPPDAPHTTVVNAATLVDYTVGAMCTKWFNLPVPGHREFGVAGVEAPAFAHYPDNFKSTARYIFSPNPTEFVTRDGRKKGTELLSSATDYVEGVLRGEFACAPDTLLAEMIARKDELIALGVPRRRFPTFAAGILLGTIHGFVGPVGGSTLSLLNEWIKNRELWRQQLVLQSHFANPSEILSWDKVSPILRPAVEQGMRIQPFPYVLHRVPVRDVLLRQRPAPRGDAAARGLAPEAGFSVEAGQKIVLGVVSAAHDASGPDAEGMPIEDLLFGGAYAPGYGGHDAAKSGLHACPGKAIGMGTILGILTALLQAGNLRRIAPRKLDLDPFSDQRMPSPVDPRALGGSDA